MTLAIHHALRTSERATQFIGRFQTAPRLSARPRLGNYSYQFSSYLLGIQVQIALGTTSTQSSQSDRALNGFGNLALVTRIGAFATG